MGAPGGALRAQLATVLGVSRQRVSALLREGGAGTATEDRPESGSGDHRIAGKGLAQVANRIPAVHASDPGSCAAPLEGGHCCSGALFITIITPRWPPS